MGLKPIHGEKTKMGLSLLVDFAGSSLSALCHFHPQTLLLFLQFSLLQSSNRH